MSSWAKLTIYIDESDRWHGKPLFTALVEAARKQGLAGATVIRGIEGFGVRQHHQIHTARMMELADLPIVVTIIDQAEAIAQFLPTVQAMIAVGLITQETTDVVYHATTQQ
jgi:PII-like signaling protein